MFLTARSMTQCQYIIIKTILQIHLFFFQIQDDEV